MAERVVGGERRPETGQRRSPDDEEKPGPEGYGHVGDRWGNSA